MRERPGRLVLIGHPVLHSLSPAFQNAALQRAGIPLVYEAMDIAPDELGSAVDRLRAARAAGNVTVPYKQAFAERCDRLTPMATRVGAVNTFWVEQGALVGDNTDVDGFSAALQRAFGAGAEWPRVTLVGAGGAAAAVAAAAERWPGTRVTVWARTSARAARLAARFAGVRLAASLDEALEETSLVVNATPSGLRDDDALPVDIGLLPAHASVYDLVYRRDETPWVRAARAAGHPAADGLTMLLEQGALAFERWLGVPPDREAMWSAMRG
ncbi:MAG: shikimate dehydrogenase [Gemmatimonadota bacterium]|nr:shikimate dehydrogenase [Gemmatimonadota bacterium]